MDKQPRRIRFTRHSPMRINYMDLMAELMADSDFMPDPQPKPKRQRKQRRKSTEPLIPRDGAAYLEHWYSLESKS